MPRRSASELVFFAEACATLAAASLAIRALPFRSLASLMGRGAISGASSHVHTNAVARAVRRASSRVPWRTVCFQEGLAVHWMLRRRGLPSHLHYGVRQAAQRLTAHVWVEVGGAVVIGEEAPGGEHHRVAVFPPV